MHTYTAIQADINLIELVEVKQGDDFTEILRFTTGFEQRAAVMKRKADELLATLDDFRVTQGARFRQG